MENNLMLLTTLVQEVSAAVEAMVNTYRTMKAIKKQEQLMLKDKLKAFQTLERTSRIGTLIRESIAEIARTQAYIDECHLEGAALSYAMDKLALLDMMLTKNLEEYR